MTAPSLDAASQSQGVVHVELELAIGSEPISGHVKDPTGDRAFTGWIDLTGAIAAAHQAATDTPC